MDKMTEQEKTIKKIETVMRTWIEEQIPIYEKMPAAQQQTTVQGERVLKANPATQEIRAAFKDYCYVVKTMRDLAGEEEVEVDSIDELKRKFKIAK